MPSPAQIFSASLIAQFAKYGANFWLAPGARSQSLAIAAAQLADAGLAKLYVRVDERSLGFQALGAGRLGQPQVIITTSGTAVANLHPAVLEAHHCGVPLILLTADRPEELRGKGANQTTNQFNIFGSAVVESFDVLAPEEEGQYEADRGVLTATLAIETAFDKKQPYHLNLQFREPLSAIEPNAVAVFKHLADQSLLPLKTKAVELPLSTKTIIVAGANADEYLGEITDLGLPIFAEPSSGVRQLPAAIQGYRSLLAAKHELLGQIEQIVVYGKPTLSREVIALLRSKNIAVFSRLGRMGEYKIPDETVVLTNPIKSTTADPNWLQQWQEASESMFRPNSNLFNRRAIIEQVWQLQEAGVLVLGASQLIREADYHAPKKAISVWSNRGLSGIDGTIATALGIASSTDRPVRVLLGDLAFLHDVGSLVIDQTEKAKNIQVVVVNDHGGKIFENLEVAKLAPTVIYDRVFRTGQNFQISELAKAFGWQYVLVSSSQELAVALQISGLVIIEARLD